MSKSNSAPKWTSNSAYDQFASVFTSGDQYGAEWVKQLEQSVSACREASDAWFKSSSVFAKGFEEVFKTCVSHAQNANEKNSALWQSMLSCRNVNDFAQAQNQLTQGSFEGVIEATTQVSELSAKVMMDAWEPLNKQMSQTMKKVNETVSA